MTVKCLSVEDKSYIAHCFAHQFASINSIALEHGRSRRTIIRVLEEAGIDPGIHRRPGAKKRTVTPAEPVEPIQQALPLHQASIPVKTPETPKTPWYQRFANWITGDSSRSGLGAR